MTTIEIGDVIGRRFLGLSAAENRVFEGDELGLDSVVLIFEGLAIRIEPIAATDELTMTVEPADEVVSGDAPPWCRRLLGKKLFTIWTCVNTQGYRDQVVFALGRLHPSISFVSEGSVLKVFLCEQASRT